jgi:hypothetical protein
VENLYAVRQKEENFVESNHWDGLWNWECESAAERYQKICVRYCVWIGWGIREEKKKNVDYTENDK